MQSEQLAKKKYPRSYRENRENAENKQGTPTTPGLWAPLQHSLCKYVTTLPSRIIQASRMANWCPNKHPEQLNGRRWFHLVHSPALLFLGNKQGRASSPPAPCQRALSWQDLELLNPYLPSLTLTVLPPKNNPSNVTVNYPPPVGKRRRCYPLHVLWAPLASQVGNTTNSPKVK
ncbi:Olfactory Receptor 14I1 [Manis pentadactyla]|nr:Olfactory Receptor 14I1 [Manis pentadactyla]